MNHFSFNTAGASKQSKGQVEKLEVDLNLTLEELYVGVTKRRKISRKRRQPNGSYVNKENILTIDVKKGWKEGTKITFNGEGDEREGYSAGDVIFVLKVSYFFHCLLYLYSLESRLYCMVFGTKKPLMVVQTQTILFFEINAGIGRIRHKTTLNFNDVIFNRF